MFARNRYAEKFKSLSPHIRFTKPIARGRGLLFMMNHQISIRWSTRFMMKLFLHLLDWDTTTWKNVSYPFNMPLRALNVSSIPVLLTVRIRERKQVAQHLPVASETKARICRLRGIRQRGKAAPPAFALGLERSQLPFVWALRAPADSHGRPAGLPEGFEERMQGRGLVCLGCVVVNNFMP
ncbi:hypothetical protein C4D60_Mb07t25320 [Musa balbisiana]|uniref:Uncharacterized protein n=1 Tax=Musa balbisiana TaxID=52838 RepID=A0A4V4H6Y0_MUSBA|nr:hypothetical protein C4D60_Mb07t25320 [Musa balbisiana]